jgi:hypothetical protein
MNMTLHLTGSEIVRWDFERVLRGRWKGSKVVI